MEYRNNTEKKTFTFFFFDGHKSVGIGTTFAEAFANAGCNCTNNLDFYTTDKTECDPLRWKWDETEKEWIRNS